MRRLEVGEHKPREEPAAVDVTLPDRPGDIAAV
jgi:hypothetical protein